LGAEPQQPGNTTRQRERIAAMALLGLAALVGAFAIDGGFVYDDPRALLYNPVVNGELPARMAFVRDYWGGPLDSAVRSYRPLLPLLWHGIWAVFPGQALAFRLLSWLLHIAATAGVLALLRRVQRDQLAAFAGAALFAVHPVHAEAISAIVSQSDLLAAALGSVALCVSLREGWGHMLLSAGLLLLACAAKETAVVFGVAIAAMAWARAPAAERGGRLALRVAPALLVVAAVVTLQLALPRTQGGVMPGSLAASLDGGMRVLYGFHAIGHAASLLVLPTGLAPHHGYAAIVPSWASLGPFAAVGLAVTALLAVLAIGGVRRRDGARLGALALLAGPLLMQSGFLVTPITDVVERLLYTPSIALCGAFGLWIARPAAHAGLRRLLLAAVMASALLLSFAAQRAWISDLALFQRAVEIEPRSWHSQKNYAAQLAQHGRVEEAAWHFLLSLFIVRQYPRPIDFAPADALASRPLAERLVEGPGQLEPANPCALSKVYIANMRRSAPALVHRLEPILRARYCRE
jgi:hypothetical protein